MNDTLFDPETPDTYEKNNIVIAYQKIGAKSFAGPRWLSLTGIIKDKKTQEFDTFRFDLEPEEEYVSAKDLLLKKLAAGEVNLNNAQKAQR